MLSEVRERIREVFGRLDQPIYLLDKTGRSIIPALPDVFFRPEKLQADKPVTLNGYLFLGLPGLENEALAVRSGSGAADSLLLAFELVREIRQGYGISGETGNALKRLLSGQMSAEESACAAQALGVPEQQARCVLVITLSDLKGQSAVELLAETLPLGRGDLLAPLDARSAALVHVLGDSGDAAELASAIRDTLQNELGMDASVGIGSAAAAMSGLRTSCDEARAALRLGKAFRKDNGVFDFRAMMLERFLDEVPPDTAARYTSRLFGKKTAKLFTDELLATLDMLFQKDLNLTDASRELFIHRNTLVYRLEKVQRVTGLDLRRFRDAMVFRLLLDLKKLEKPTDVGSTQERIRS